jgi:hypothetical protein
MVCVITRRSSAHGKGFHRCSLRFHPHVAAPSGPYSRCVGRPAFYPSRGLSGKFSRER